jgi:chemotaxis protein MotB
MALNKEREVPIRFIIKKKRGHGGHHGGAWKVAFADFMTSMFALFLVLWLVNQSSDVKSAIAGYFQDPLGRASEYGSSILPGEGAQASSVRPLDPPSVVELRRDRLQMVAERLKSKLDKVPALAAVKDKVEILLTDDGLRIQLIEDANGVFFETGSANLSARGQEILALLGRELGTLPNRVRIEGHTDARQYSQGNPYTNWELSADRANAARRILTTNGLAPDQISQIRGLADRELRDPANPLSPSNRRITITMLLGPMLPSDSTATGPTVDHAAGPPATTASGVPAVGASGHSSIRAVAP